MINRALVVLGFVAVSIFGGLGLKAFATDNPPSLAAVSSTSDTFDVALHDKVETLLRTNVGLAGSQFRIQAKAGVVTVGGTVPDEHSLRRALDLASNVKGVREVRNALEIESPK